VRDLSEVPGVDRVDRGIGGRAMHRKQTEVVEVDRAEKSVRNITIILICHGI
jgi:hypothetical protein